MFIEGVTNKWFIWSHEINLSETYQLLNRQIINGIFTISLILNALYI